MLPKCSNLVQGYLGISYKWYGFGVERSRSKLGLGLTAIRRGFELYECLLVIIIIIIITQPFAGITYFRPFLNCLVVFDREGCYPHCFLLC